LRLELVQVLTVAVGVAAASTVAEPDVEIAVGTERELTAVVVEVLLRRLEEHLLERRVELLRVPLREVEPRDARPHGVRRIAVIGPGRVADEDLTVRGEPRVERDREEALLVPELRAHARAD